MKRKSMLVLLLGGGVLLLGTAIALYFFLLHQPSSSKVPDLIDLTPLPSLTELAEKYPQIAPLLSDAQLDAVYKEFLIAYQTGGPEAAAALAQERGLFTPDGLNLRVTLVLDTEDNSALTEELRAAGIEVVSSYRDRVNVSVPLALIEEQFLSQEAGEDTALVFQQLTQLEHVIAVRLPETRKPESLNPAGGILGEGVSLVGADAWHAAGFTGAGLRIGVLDLGFAGYEALLGTELPLNVTLQTFGWYDTAEVHGAACAEIIHEVAPGATLFFAWYDGSDAALGEAVEWLRTQKVNIISHSVGAVVSPRDGTGWGTHLVEEVAAEGVLWVNSAGNEARTHHRGIFTDEDGDGYHEFSADDEVLAIYSLDEVEVYLVWEDNWQRPVQDLELLIVDAQGNVLTTSEEPQDGTLGQRPAEVAWVRTDGDTVYAVVKAFNVTQPVTLDIFVHGSNAEVAQPSSAYSVSSPGDAVGALTVGATNWWNDRLAGYSSQGPTTDGRLKPDISAPAGVSGATYGESGFDGTSASTPHVAGVAALVWEANPGFTREQLKDYLLVNALDFGPAGPDTGFGYGRLQLPAAVPGLVLPPTPTVPAAETPLPPTATATAVSFVTLEAPIESPPQGRSSNAGTALLGLFIGGLGCTGAGFLLTAVAIVVRSGRAAPHQLPRSAYSAPAGPVMPPRTPPVQPRPAPPPNPVPLELPATERVGSVPKPLESPHPPAAATPVETLVCPVCGARARPGARFCAGCGSPLDFKAAVQYCRRCGAELRPTSRFCSRCGEPAINRGE